MIDLVIYIAALIFDSSFLFNVVWGIGLAFPLAVSVLIIRSEGQESIIYALLLGLIAEIILGLPLGVIMIGLLFSLLVVKLIYSVVNFPRFEWLSLASWIGYYVIVLVMLFVFYLVSGMADSYVTSASISIKGFSSKIFIETLLGLLWLGILKKN